ncbi:class I SAM-dependent methyltransferase [Acidiferrimicrobium sp. IK]|uniref:class I SAM-dependent methyltransferase n=1 Tax=Acidiferrimicrobium sp. IK TaxID=2871700 RepID=UPI0021CAFD9D|nr:class I SAM-dependent methyltransferase [Acidiferrimicrobium sp. IK]MCU4185878.1 class I SAM-dependent methyltransferase [Acidiferrimicrobium sp. IK]
MHDRRHATSWATEEEGTRYERGRPTYPDQAGPILAEQLRLGAGEWVADVAAGTGKLTRVLATTGADVLAVEPMPGMRARLREVTGPRVAAGTAEHLPLRDASLRGATVAQAFHWFRLPEAAAELRRVLQPEGRLAIVTNGRDPAWSAVERVADILGRYEALGPRPESVGAWREGLYDSGVFARVERIELPHEQRFETWDDFNARFESISFAILLAAPQRAAMLDELRAAVGDTLPVVVPLRTVIEVWAPVA